jgi:hypothetical protein
MLGIPNGSQLPGPFASHSLGGPLSPGLAQPTWGGATSVDGAGEEGSWEGGQAKARGFHALNRPHVRLHPG